MEHRLQHPAKTAYGSAECRMLHMSSLESMQVNLDMDTQPVTMVTRRKHRQDLGKHRPVMPMSSYCFTAPDCTRRTPSF